MKQSLALALLACLVTACQSSPEDHLPVAVGVPTEVEVLDAGFVRFEGERMALEFFLLEMRERVRAHWGETDNLPAVTVVVAADAPGVDGRWVSELREELYKAGVPRMILATP